MSPISSPCTRICMIDPQSGLCHGCGRTLSEIAQWAGLPEPERLRIIAELPGRRAGARAEDRPKVI